MTRVKTIKILAMFCVLAGMNLGWAYHVEQQKENYQVQLDTQQEIAYNNSIEIEELTNALNVQKEEINTLSQEKEEQEVPKVTTTASVTHYTHTGNPTASGKMPTAGRTVACNFLPLGSRIAVNGTEYIVEDRVGLDGAIVDVFVDSEEEAIQRGRYSAEIQILD